MPELHDEQEHDEQINDASGESQDGHNETGEIEGNAGAKKPTGDLVVPAGKRGDGRACMVAGYGSLRCYFHLLDSSSQ